MNAIENKNTIDDFIFENEVLIVNYFATWCVTCKKIIDNLMEIEIEFQNRIKILNIDVDKDSILALQRNVRVIPCILYFKNGKLYNKETGFKTKEHLEKNINTLCNLDAI